MSVLSASGAPSTPADLDPSFGSGGIVTTDFGASEAGEAMALMPDGRIVVVGGMNPDSTDFDSDEFVAARYTADGHLDPSFDGDGKVTTDIGGARDEGRAVIVQLDGKIVVGGWAFASGGGPLTFALARYNLNGSLDTGFGGDGKVSTVFPSSYGSIEDLALQPDGKIVAVGGQCGAVCDVAVARYLTDGAPDPSFSGDGKTITAIGGSAGVAVALQADGKIVVAGRRCPGTCTEFALLRYASDGSLDPTFDGDGMVFTDLGAANEAATAVALQSDGRIVAAGHAGPDVFALARYNGDGSLDPSFGGDGTVTDPVGNGAEAVVIRGDGKIVVGGADWGGASRSEFALVRLNPDGNVDTTFSRDGRVVMDFNQTHDYVTTLAVQPDGSILAAGTSGVVGDPGTPFAGDFALARFLADGAPPPPPPPRPPPPAPPPPGGTADQPLIDVALPRKPDSFPLASTHSLAVSVRGNGTVAARSPKRSAASPGAVPAIRCGTAGFACVDRLDAKARVSLVARAAPGFAFSRWNSGCSGRASTCNVVLSRDAQVFATFTPKTAAATVAASLAPPRLRVGWQASVGKGELVVRGRVSRAARLRVELRRPGGGPLVARRVRVAGGQFRVAAPLRPGALARGALLLPGGFVVVVRGRSENLQVPLQVRSLVLAAPPEGVVRRAHASLSENGPPLLILPARTQEAWATFRLEAQPRAALKPTVSWFNPAGKLVGTVEKPNRPLIVSSARAGAPLASGLWRVELRAGGRLVKALAIRIAAA